ncbi:hypothetical protein PCC9214_02597 [Planktothrix tepida]|uniref:Uncharacterized protein n=3 Tax=Planktothrix TaxID=54304 RepID=A0A1J1LJ68_9CYAN|nr:EamA family transporter [Planktothrix tepida]CAD5951710.1 hypothetical protein PCC9214_02597 [Planktothrix tepida]CUR32645.1 exported hypothetical protein [Planktothrix tepida PCC 9214]
MTTSKIILLEQKLPNVLTKPLNLILLFIALFCLSFGFVTVFLLLEPVITAILAWIIFAEHLGIVNCLAFILILLGIYIAKTGQGAEKS